MGFTSDEVKRLCAVHDVDYEECKIWYDGYKQRNVEIYNPKSVVKCLEDKNFEGYCSKP